MAAFLCASTSSTIAAASLGVRRQHQQVLCVSKRLAAAGRDDSSSKSSVVRGAQLQATTRPSATVKMVIQGRKLEVTDAIKKYIEEKMSKAVAKYAQEVKEVDVTLSARGGDTGTHGKKEQKVDVTIYTVHNGIVRVEDSEETLYASIDVVADKLDRKLHKLKDLAISKGTWPGRAGPKAVAEEEADFKEFLSDVQYQTEVFDREEQLRAKFEALNKEFPAAVRRTKVMTLDPMTVDEAIEAMEQVGHDFFVLREMTSDSIQVVYRRKNGGYGVLIPQKRD